MKQLRIAVMFAGLMAAVLDLGDYFKRHAVPLAFAAFMLLAVTLGVVQVHDLGIAGMAGMAMLNIAPFPVTPELTAVAVAYKNNSLIADGVAPRVPVGTQSFKYNKYPIGEFFSVPKTEVGRKSKPGSVEFTATEADASTVNHALDDEVPQDDIDNAKSQPGMPDPLGRAALGVTKLIELAREIRVSNLVFAGANYHANNQDTLSGEDQWSDYTHSTPVKDITEYLDSMVMRARIAVYGRRTWSVLSQHPQVCKAIFGNNTDAGIVSRQAFANLFELEEVLVGEGWVNTAKKGQAANLVRVWGNHAAFLYRNRDADTRSDVTFAMTAQWGSRFAGNQYDKDIGMRGGQCVRVGESVKELITANDLGFFVENAVADAS